MKLKIISTWLPGHANNTLNLLDDLLEWTISQNREKSFNPVKINLHKLLRDEIECINTSARQKQITLHHSIAPNLNVSADLQMVKTIFQKFDQQRCKIY